MKINICIFNNCLGFRKRKWTDDIRSPKRPKRKQLVPNKRETDWVPQIDSDESENESGTPEVSQQIMI